MKINTNTLLINLLLAGLSEKMLKNKYAGLPKSWKTKQALSMALLPDPAIGMMLHQNELIKEDEKIMQLNQEKTDEGITIIKEFLIDEAIPPEIRRNYTEEIKDLLKTDIFTSDEPVPFAIVEEIPIFPEGPENASHDVKKEYFRNSMEVSFNDNFGYPDEGPASGSEVLVMFIIEKDGSISGVIANAEDEVGYEDIRAEVEYEAISVIKERFPQMNPGKHLGKVVRVSCSIALTFQMGEDYSNITVRLM